jgi:hypothetical protein
VTKRPAAQDGLYETVKPMPLNEGENERARQEKYGLGPFRWLGDAPPSAGAFSPVPGGLGPFRLEGAADVKVTVAVDLPPDLIARRVDQAVTARGNMRSDTGMSMPRSIMPYGSSP